MKAIACVGIISSLLTLSLLKAEDKAAVPGPLKEHAWLQQFVGEWESVSEATVTPGQAPMTCKGTMSSRSLGGIWVVSEVKSEMMGVPMHAIQTLGYDPQAKRYIGTWIDSMFNHMWKYEGIVDDAGKVLTLEAEGPNFVQEGKTAKYRDIYEFKSKDHVVMTSSMQGDDGKWTVFMKGNVHRKKK